MPDLPSFRYHPDPISSRVFESSDSTCPCCGEARGYVYVGPFYSTADVEVCPWCIASGEASRKFDASFVNSGAVEQIDNAIALDELQFRTPAYFVAQREPWPAHCADYCAVIAARPTLAEVARLTPELTLDLEAMRVRLGISHEQLQSELQREHSPLWLALFRCLHCGRFRITGDYE